MAPMATVLLPQNPNVWAQKGHLWFLMGNFAEAKACYERTVSFVTDAKDMHFVYMRLGSIYLEGKEVRRENGLKKTSWMGRHSLPQL